MTPLYFGDCFGWLHPANGGRGAVICGAHGIEELCTHRFMRHLADELAAAGMPTLRFDYHGTGDSLGSDADPDRVQQWLASIQQAVECLKIATGVSEVVLVGFRLGSLLATQLAIQRSDIAMLALLGPVASGKSYLREMKALGLIIGQTTRAAPPGVIAPDVDDVVVAGFTITAATKDELQKIDLLTAQRAPAPRVLITGRPNAAADERLAQHLSSLGCQVKQAVLPGSAELQWDTSFATLPSDAFTAVVRWLAQDLPAPRVSVTAYQPVTDLRSSEWHEQPVSFGPEQRLFGIRCEPLSPRDQYQDKLILFVNHGSNPHTGWARMYVTLARRFATVGIASLRMDISGMGDSPAHPHYAENQLYARHSQIDVYAALDWSQQASYESIILIGHCAGAYLSFYSALRDVRVSKLVMLNLQRFFWARGELLESASKQTYHSSGWYWTVIRDPQMWRRLLTGKVNASGIALALVRRLFQRGYSGVVGLLGPLLGTEGLSGKVVRWLRELSSRGTRVLLVYSSQDGGLDEIAEHTGANGKKVRKLANVKFHIIEGADHNLTSAWSQEAYAKVLEKFLTE